MKLGVISLLAAGCFAGSAAAADITVGFVTSHSGPGSSIGIPYAKGVAAGYEYKSDVGGGKVRLIQLDDASDPSASTRDARKLVEEEKVDIILGTSSVPATVAMASIANELKVPMVALSPITVPPTGDAEKWVVAAAQPPALMVKVVADRMKRDGIKNLGYIGFSDAWGDLVYNGAKAGETADGFKITTNERYARTDNSVTGQILKIVATRPDGVLDGGSGTQGALPLLTLAERGYKGKLYGTPALVNPDFIRVGGKAAEGITVSTGPVMVAEQLPDDHYAKKISLAYRDAYKKANGTLPSDGFSAYAFDAWLIFLQAAERAKGKAEPGTPAFRRALRDEIFSTKDLAGTQGLYNFTPASSYGVDERGLVLVRLVDGAWKYAP